MGFGGVEREKDPEELAEYGVHTKQQVDVEWE